MATTNRKKTTNPNNKRGPWSEDEKQYIAENVSKMGYEEIAMRIRRNVEVVKKYIKENHASSFVEKAKTAEYDIKNSYMWKDLERQFSPEELKMFLFHWGRIISQFRDDVYPTEEIQVIDTIKLEILMNRAVTQQQQVMQDIYALEQTLLTEKNQDPPDLATINNIERQIAILRAAQESLNKDFLDMLKQKNAILGSMKATRDARIKHLESSKQNFMSLIRNIISNKELRYRLGLDMEKMRIATDVEYQRLSEYHQFADGMVDQPLLTPENAIEG